MLQLRVDLTRRPAHAMVPRLFRLALVAVVLATMASLRSDATTGNRVALIIGNAAYGADIGPLANPVNDARLMARTLTRANFAVVTLENLDQRGMKRAIRDFGTRLRSAGDKAVGLFYYAGHAFQSRGENWLVPVGARIQSEADADLEAVSANSVLSQMEEARTAVNIVVLDACRNPLIVRRFRSTERGLRQMQAPQGSFIAYSTAPGDTAEDGSGSNSRYTAALASEIERGGKVEDVFKRVRQRLVKDTGGDQTPWDSSSLVEDFVFGRPAAPRATPPAQSSGPAPSAPVSAEEQELEAWKSLGADPSKAELEAFLKAFPNGKYAGLARAKIKTIEERERAQARPAAPAPSTTAPAETRPAQVAGPGKDCAECPEMVRIPGRSFMAGKYEVTFAEWDACVAGGGCNGVRPADEGWGRGRRPVINVSWNDAQAYVQWLSKRTGKRYRLLTSEEWEFAARAGTTSEYSWGNEEPVCNESARNGANFDACPDDRTRPVGSFPANGFGLHDVHGNVEEWVEDCDDGDCSRRVLRGGTWVSSPQSLRSAIRSRSDPSISDNFMGFRVARTL
jgi:formylglycine-generating enzyme required for sulfatase activity